MSIPSEDSLNTFVTMFCEQHDNDNNNNNNNNKKSNNTKRGPSIGSQSTGISRRSYLSRKRSLSPPANVVNRQTRRQPIMMTSTTSLKGLIGNENFAETDLIDPNDMDGLFDDNNNNNNTAAFTANTNKTATTSKSFHQRGVQSRNITPVDALHKLLRGPRQQQRKPPVMPMPTTDDVTDDVTDYYGAPVDALHDDKNNRDDDNNRDEDSHRNQPPCPALNDAHSMHLSQRRSSCPGRTINTLKLLTKPQYHQPQSQYHQPQSQYHQPRPLLQPHTPAAAADSDSDSLPDDWEDTINALVGDMHNDNDDTNTDTPLSALDHNDPHQPNTLFSNTTLTAKNDTKHDNDYSSSSPQIIPPLNLSIHQSSNSSSSSRPTNNNNNNNKEQEGHRRSSCPTLGVIVPPQQKRKRTSLKRLSRTMIQSQQTHQTVQTLDNQIGIRRTSLSKSDESRKKLRDALLQLNQYNDDDVESSEEEE